MSKFTVYFTTPASMSVTVEAEDYDEAIETAWDKIARPGSFVYASHPRGFDLAGEWEPECVVDDSDKTVWSERA